MGTYPTLTQIPADCAVQMPAGLSVFSFRGCACERVSELNLNTHLACVLSPGPEAGDTLVQHK